MVIINFNFNLFKGRSQSLSIYLNNMDLYLLYGCMDVYLCIYYNITTSLSLSKNSNAIGYLLFYLFILFVYLFVYLLVHAI